jgi:PTS system nitrogen regulatory IIA component
MNQIIALLPPSQIVADLDVSSKKRVFEQAGLLFENHYGIGRSQVYDALFAREKLGSTALGRGVAIPHGRIKGLKEARGAFFRLASAVPFDAPDNAPVRLLFIMLVPEAANEWHLQLLSELAQMFSDAVFRDKLDKAPDVAALHEIFAQWSPVS